MKFKHVLIFTLLFSVLLILSNCKQDCEDEDKEVSNEFIISTDSSKNNSGALKGFSYQMSATIESFDAQVNIKQNNFKQFEGVFQAMVEEAETKQKVLLATEIAKIFDPKECPCNLPGKVKNKLSGKHFAPGFVVAQLKRFPAEAIPVDGVSIAAVLNTVGIKSVNGDIKTFPMLQSPSFKKFDVKNYLIDGAYDDFLYSLDCSGYMNAAVQASGAAIIGEASTNAKLALEGKNTMFVAGGTLASPVYSAYYGNALGTNMDTTTMIAVLKSLLAIPDIKDSDSVNVPSAYVAIWASKSGQGTLNGQGDLSAKGGAGFGIASFTSSTSSGGQLSRTSSFNSYNTYIVDEERLTKKTMIKVTDIKNRVTELDK